MFTIFYYCLSYAPLNVETMTQMYSNKNKKN